MIPMSLQMLMPRFWYFQMAITRLPKWIAKWRGDGTLKSIVGHYCWVGKKNFLNFRCTRIAKIVKF